MKITRFQVLDPLDWGARDQPYLVVTIEDALSGGKEKQYGDFNLVQYGPFFEFTGPSDVGRFNTLDPSHHSTRLISVQLQVGLSKPIPYLMDLKRARYELRKVQGSTQNWSIRLETYHTERTGEAIYIPVKIQHNTCGGWFEAGGIGERCGGKQDLTLLVIKGRQIFYCKDHLAEFKREQFARRVAS